MMLLETSEITKRFGGVTAVDDVSFELPTGQIHALIGPNGAGKSTFVGLVAGRIQPTAGRVHFDGRDVTALPAHRRIQAGMAYTFQITSIYNRLSLADNVSLALGDRDPTRIDAALALVRLEDRAGQLAGDLSYGHRRLLEIAMGAAQAPKLLILDEPTQGLAEAEIEGFLEILRGMKGETTILLIEHNMNVVMAIAEAITVLDQGRVLASGTPADIRADPAVQAAYLGSG
ncbi:MAG: ABC transporter ATP-binding protein [Pseudomonadota bacterium]